MENENSVLVPGKLHCVSDEGKLASTNEIYDDDLEKYQSDINEELYENIINKNEKTTINNNDSIILKDENEKEYFISKSNFIEAVRAALGAVLTGVDKGTSITRVPVITSSDLGSVTKNNFITSLYGSFKLLPCLRVRTDNPLPATAWYRVFSLTLATGIGYGNYLIHVSTGQTYFTPSPTLFLLSYGYKSHALVQLGKRPKQAAYDITKVRAIQKNTTVYFDIRHVVSSQGGNNAFICIYPLNGSFNGLTAIQYTDVSDDTVGTNYTEITPEVAG